MTNRELAERAVGVLVTFVVARTASRLTLGISFPGTVVGIAAVAGAAVCGAGQATPAICRAQQLVNWPGNQVGQLLVGAADKGIALLERT